MNENLAIKIIDRAIETYIKCSNNFNYMSLKQIDKLEQLLDEDYCKTHNVFVLNNLNKQIIHFGQPSKFNDPNEFVLDLPVKEWIDFFSLDAIGKNMLLNALNKNNNFFKSIKIFSKDTQIVLISEKKKLDDLPFKIAKNNRDKYGIFCLAPSPYNSYFWREYCNNYNGICCEYDLSRIHPVDHNFILKVNYGDKIIYKPEYISLETIKDLNKFSKCYPNIVNKLKPNSKESFDAAKALMSTKSIKWEIELENRLITCLTDHKGIKQHNADLHAVPRKIYIGYKVANEIKTYLIEFCDKNEIKWEIVSDEQCVDFSQYKDYIHSKICKIE